VVVWVYAGGAEAEAMGLIPFLEQHFNHEFERRLPRLQRDAPRYKPERLQPQQGTQTYEEGTGDALARRITKDLVEHWESKVEAIFIVDDLDCADSQKRTTQLREAVTRANQNVNIPIIVGFAAPELESWLIADWGNSIGKEDIWKTCQHTARKYLEDKKVDFNVPESFDCHDENGKYVYKLSHFLIEAIETCCQGTTRFSKGTDTPRLLKRSNPNVIQRKCPLFRQFWVELQNLSV
jgi:hypothetical protein